MADNNTVADIIKYAAKRSSVHVAKRASDKIMFPHVTTGVFVLDMALGGGIQENSIATFVGRQSSGKTTSAYKVISQFQKKYNGIDNPKRTCVFIDVEHTFDPVWAGKNGVDTDELLLIEPLDGDEAVDIACTCMENPEVCLVVMDSIPALVTGKELEKSVGDVVIAQVANLTLRFLRKASHAIAVGANTGNFKTLICINQWRDKAGVVFGDPRNMTGGKAQRYWVSTEIDFTKKKEEEGSNDDNMNVTLYNEHAFKILKNKTGNYINAGDFDLVRYPYDGLQAGDVDDAHTVVTYAQKIGLITGAGKGWTLIDPDTGEYTKFGGKSEIIAEFRRDSTLKNRYAKAVIMKLRASQGQKADPYSEPSMTPIPDDIDEV